MDPNKELVLNDFRMIFQMTEYLECDFKIDDVSKALAGGKIFVPKFKKKDGYITDKTDIAKMLCCLSTTPLVRASADEIPVMSIDSEVILYDKDGNELLRLGIYPGGYIKDYVSKRVYRCPDENIEERLNIAI